MADERSSSGARVFGRIADTTGDEVKVQAALDSPAGPRTWLITGGASLRFDLPNAKRLIAALAKFVEETEAADPGRADVEFPAGEAERLRDLMERTSAVADEWREYAETLPDGPLKARALNLAATIYVERIMSGLHAEPET
ncbi:MAG TPA: hypothetical protein VF170_18875 [Planctomycetaceae bacterium]